MGTCKPIHLAVAVTWEDGREPAMQRRRWRLDEPGLKRPACYPYIIRTQAFLDRLTTDDSKVTCKTCIGSCRLIPKETP